jgi:hypothetical protein
VQVDGRRAPLGDFPNEFEGLFCFALAHPMVPCRDRGSRVHSAGISRICTPS